MLQQWLRDRCTPLVATLVTEDADIACRKNNLTFEQLVSAFGRMDGLKVPFRSSSQQLSLDSFSCRFVRGSSMRPAPSAEGDPSLAGVATRVTTEASAAAARAGMAADEGEKGAAAAAEALLDSSATEDQEWYKQFRSKLWEGLCHQEHEMLDCPAAILVVVSSTEASGDPIACLDELSSPRYLPPPFQSRQYDPQTPTIVYLLLHDWCLGAAHGVDPDRIFSQMRGTFTSGQCRMLCINSLPAESPNLSQPDIWPDADAAAAAAAAAREGMSEASGGEGRLVGGGGGGGIVRGRCLSPEDLLATKDFVHGLATQVVVPSMERRILGLNATVSSVRKGVKNFVKSWLRKPRDSVDVYGGDGGAAGGATYGYHRIESQIRLLADSAFLMRDFDTAASMYRMVRDDFKSDRALLHYASASEMLGVSLFLQQQRRAAAAVSSSTVSSPSGGYITAVSPSSGGLSGALGGAIVGGVATAAATAANVATAAAVGAGGVRDLSWQTGGGGFSPVGGQQQQQLLMQQHGNVAPISGTGSSSGHGGGGGGFVLNPAALLGRGREADTAFAAALETYQRRASEDSTAAATVYGGGKEPSLPPSARLGARAALLYADVASAASEELLERVGGSRNGPGGARAELQAQAEEALLNASVLETPLCAAVLLEVSASRCREAGRLRRSAFRLVQAGHMYKSFAKDHAEAFKQQQQQQQQQHGGLITASSVSAIRFPSPKFAGMHAARCFLGALSGYSGSGWLAAEEYACTVLPTELRALQRPVAALQLYVRLVAAAGERGGQQRSSADGSGGGSGSTLGGSSTHSQQQLLQQQQQEKQQKRAARESSLMATLEDLFWRYPEAARVASRAWERGRESSKLDMSFFPITERARGPPPPSQRPAAPSSVHGSNEDLLGIDAGRAEGGGGGAAGASARAPGGEGSALEGDGSARGGRVASTSTRLTKGVGTGVVFEGLSLPRVVHEETRTVDTENAWVEASVQATESSTWAQEMAESLKAELAAADAVRAGKGPWLTLSTAYGHQATTSRDGTLASTRRASATLPPARPAHVGEPVTIMIVLENLLAVTVSVEDVQLVLTTPGTGGGGEEEEVPCLALDEDDFQKIYSGSSSPRTKGRDDLLEMFASTPSTAQVGADPTAADYDASVAIERRRATIAPGERLPILLKFCALRPAAAALTVSAVRWTVFRWNASKEEQEGESRMTREGTDDRCPRFWVSHRLEGKGKLLHGTLEQRAARARAPAPCPRFEAAGSMPWLGCSLDGVPPTLLQGEIVRATLKVTNRGRAPAGHLCLKTNLPWVAFDEPFAAGAGPDGGGGGAAAGAAAAAAAATAEGADGSAVKKEEGSSGSGRATGGAVGASGTTLIPPVGVIMPGESVELPLWVRGRGGGRQTVRAIVRYRRALPNLRESGSGGDSGVEGAGGMEATDGPLFRLERHAPVSVEMCVLPSLSVAASVLPSYSRRGEYVLSLEATNYRSNGDGLGGEKHLRINKVCSISRCWQMEPLAGFPSEEASGAKVKAGTGDGSDERGDGSAGGTIVHWQERITLHYRLFPVDARDGEEHPEVRHNDCRLGGVVLGKGNEAGSADSPHLPLLCLEQAASNYHSACRKHRQQKLAEEAAAADEQPRTIQGLRRERDKERAIEALKKEEEDEERRWRTQKHAHPTSPGALCAPDVSLVHLMVLWGLDGNAGVPARAGQHHVRSLIIRPERVDRQCPLVLTVKYPSEVSWDAITRDEGGVEGGGVDQGGCDAEVTVCATNRLAGPGDSANVNFTFEVRADDGPRRLASVPGAPPLSGPGAGGGGGGGGGQGSSAKRPPRNRFVWLGPTKRRVVGLGPGEATMIPLKVRFLRPGVFDLNRFRFVVEFAPPPAGGGKSPPALPAPQQQQQQQQQRRDPSASQQGRVTFVFPAQYLVTVAPPPPPPRQSPETGNKEAVPGTGMGSLVSAVSSAFEEVSVA